MSTCARNVVKYCIAPYTEYPMTIEYGATA